MRLINPAKNEIGRISKSILDKINKRVKNDLELNQWKNTTEVIEWFKNINDKQSNKFVEFDIKDFYPSITESLRRNALEFASNHTPITPEEFEIIFHARKSLLFNNKEVWRKKQISLLM